MLAPSIDSSIYISTFLTSLLGSFHCLGMCGGIVLVIDPLKGGALFYHLGRLVSYLLMGVLAGYLGHQFF